MAKIILDLCGGTGSWSKPYKDAGYDVRVINTPLYDVRNFEVADKRLYFWTTQASGDTTGNILLDDLYGILAAPPCTMFSMARTTAKTPRDLKGAMEIVEACLKVIWACQYRGKRLKFWALENPKARLRWFLGAPALTFNPYDFGEPYRKPTDIWGNFNTALKHDPVELTVKQRKQSHMNMQQLPQLPKSFVTPPDMSRRSSARSITPAGFAKAFYKANK